MKCITKTVRHYWKYHYETWSQPILSSNGTMGGTSPAASASSTHGSYDGQPWRAFNGQGTSSSGWANNNVAPPQWIQFYNPVAFDLMSFTVINRSNIWKTFTLKASNDGSTWKDLQSYTNDNLVTDSSWTKTVDTDNQDNYKYYRFYITETTNYADVKQIILQGSIRSIIEGTPSDYDFYTDDEVVMLPMKNVRYYWKYQDKTFEQPVLSSNGTIGADDFAVGSTCPSYPNTIYKAFDNNSSTYSSAYFADPNNNKSDCIIYSNNPLLITSLTIDFYIVTSARVYYSDDNVTYTECGVVDRGSSYSRTTVTINVDTDNTYHKYYKIYYRNDAGLSIPNIYTTTITAQERVVVAATEQDYDFYTDDNTYFGINQ